jgi:hypothetical protein
MCLGDSTPVSSPRVAMLRAVATSQKLLATKLLLYSIYVTTSKSTVPDKAIPNDLTPPGIWPRAWLAIVAFMGH